jgi:hypothetical protein
MHSLDRCVCVCVCVFMFIVCVCVFITAVPLIKLFVWGDGESGGHVLRETTSRGLCGLVCQSRTSEHDREGDCVKEGGGGEGESARGSVHWGCYHAPLPMTLGISRCGRRLSARHWVWRCRYSPPSPAATSARPPCAAARSTAQTRMTTTGPPVLRTVAQPKRTTGRSEFWALSSAQLVTPSALSIK